METESRDYYLILTRRLPFKPYEIEAGYTLRAIRATEEMLDAAPCSVYTQRMALQHLDESSHNVYRDLVIFHSFIEDNSETYQYAEFLERSDRFFLESELDFIDDLVAFHISPEKFGPFVFSKYGSTDFDRFPVIIFHDPQDVAIGSAKDRIAPTVPEEWSDWFEGMRFRKDQQTAYALINYRVAFEVFRKLVSIDTVLSSQICLYVFTNSLWKIIQIYRNDYLTAALYVAILEAFVQVPSDCNCGIRCKISGNVIQHRSGSLGKLLADEYGHWFKDLREMRQKFIHDIDHFDFLDSIHNIHDQWSKGEPITEESISEEHSFFDTKDNIDKLGRVVRKSLIGRFLHHYYRTSDAR